MSKISKKTIIAVVLIMSVIPLSAYCEDGRKVISLEECKEMAMQNNAEVKNASLEFQNAVDTKKSLFTKYFPNISAGGSYFTTDNSAAKFVLLPGIGVPIGKDGLMGGVMAVQPVFAGGKIIAGNQLGQVGVEVGKLKLDAKKRDVLSGVERNYWMLVSLKEKMKTVEAAEALISNLEKDVENLVDAGVRDRKDLLEVKYAKNDIMTKRMELENGISLSRLALVQYIGLDPSEPFDVDTAIGRDLKEPGYYLADHDIAVDYLPETKMLDKSIKAKKLEYRLKVGEYMPTIGIGASYQYHNLLNSNHSFGAVFAMVTVPISNWWEGSYEARKKLREVEMAENSVEQARELLKLRMQKIWDELYAAYMKVSLSEESVEIAEENYRYSKESYDAGMLSMSELLDDYVRLVTSENGNTDAKIEYMLKCREYVDATGGVAGSGSY